MSISLPLEAESVLCRDFARQNDVDPGGTALAPDVVVLVEVPEPWPKPVGKHDALQTLVGVAQAQPEQIRLLAAVPHDAAAPRVIALRPAPGGMLRAERPLGHSPTSSLLAVLAESDPLEVSVSGASARTMLVCTQGSHDVCCGTHGSLFADSLEVARPDVEVFRVSHTGGHKFAPTAMSLPDGRMWAYLTNELAAEIANRNGDPAALAAICRGWWGAPTGPAQVAERAVFALVGFPLDELDRSVSVEESGGGQSTRVSVQVATGDNGVDTYDVEVSMGREVPTIACDMPGGQPVKPGREWVVTGGPTKR